MERVCLPGACLFELPVRHPGLGWNRYQAGIHEHVPAASNVR